jgi:hypothetical protein
MGAYPIPPKWPLDTGAETTAPIWRKRLVCSNADRREIDMVVTGSKRG